MVIMRWNGGKKSDRPVALVGKGVTFDTGGIDIKPATAMEEMKYDMCGAGAVVGAMKAIALNKVKANVVGAVGLAENMPDGNAIRPADVLVSHAGKTVEILNTDAEGRLVLMDVLSHVQKTDKPSHIIDLATLTGAIVVALGNTYAGAFVNDDKFWNTLDKLGADVGDPLWRMPLHADYRKAMEGTVSDLQNLSAWDRAGGSCTAAGFLEHFIDKGVKWAHLDIAATAYGRSIIPGPKGATGYGVRLLYKWVKG
jgi:leucyl aminopeptidase